MMHKHAKPLYPLLLAAGLTFAASPRLNAQTQAIIQIEAVAQHQDPHPATYIWEGENEPIKDPVQFYTYYYTGTVSPDATVPLAETVQRIAVPNSDWEANRIAIVSALTSYYQEAYNLKAAEGTGNQVVFDENYNYVEVPKDKQGAVDPRALAEWTFYYDQFVLWQFYVRRVILNDPEAKSANSPREELQKKIDLSALKNFEGVDPNQVLEAVQAAREGEMTPEQIEKAKAKAQKAALEAKKAKGGKAAREAAQAAGAITAEAATEFNPGDDYANPANNDIFREEFIDLAKEREKKSADIYKEMLDRIEERADANDRLKDWLKGKSGELKDFAQAWNKVKNGDNSFFDDTFMLMTREPLDSVPYNSINVLVRDVITPQDLLDEDGKLKRPADE